MRTDARSRILAFAQQIDRPDLGATQKAVERGWLTRGGSVTRDGLALLEALADQRGNRSVFRTIL